MIILRSLVELFFVLLFVSESDDETLRTLLLEQLIGRHLLSLLRNFELSPLERFLIACVENTSRTLLS